MLREERHAERFAAKACPRDSGNYLDAVKVMFNNIPLDYRYMQKGVEEVSR